MTADRSTEVGHGYTLADLDAMARAAVCADRSMASDAHTRYGVAWSAIALALVEAPHWPRRETLVRVGWQAIYDEVRQMRHTLGMARDANDRPIDVPMAAGHRAQAYWYWPTVSFEDHLVERLAVAPILATLTDTERDAVVALAVHDDYDAAARALGIHYPTLTRRLTCARRRFWRRWYAPDAPPPVRGADRRVGTRAQPPATHCGQGHELTPENTRARKNERGWVCRVCERERGARRPGRGRRPAA